jgi:CTP:molybdopterin cytidylyltransferase MocA
MSESLSAVVVAAGRSQRMGFDKLLTPLAGRPLLLHTLDRIFRTETARGGDGAGAGAAGPQ